MNVEPTLAEQPRAFVYNAEQLAQQQQALSYKLTNTSSVCPLCSIEHIICQFAAGTLYCCRRNCPNPHHRSYE